MFVMLTEEFSSHQNIFLLTVLEIYSDFIIICYSQFKYTTRVEPSDKYENIMDQILRALGEEGCVSIGVNEDIFKEWVKDVKNYFTYENIIGLSVKSIVKGSYHI